MDAVVFFVIAITISSTMFYYARGEAGSATSARPEGQSDPDAVLRVFLHASVGEETVLELNGDTHISASSEICECLRIELDALVLGADQCAFAPLNERLLTILEATCSVVLVPYLTASWFLDDDQKEILAIPDEPPDTRTRYASSMGFPGAGGSAFLLTLVLVPASFLEILDVSAGDLDLGPGVGQSPADLQP